MRERAYQAETPEENAGYVRTDLACEKPGKPEDLRRGAAKDGAEYTEYTRGEIRVSRLKIRNAEGAKALGQGVGTYVTVTSGEIQRLSMKESDNLCAVLLSELRRMAEEVTGKKITKGFSVLVAGLGNAEMTADAIGPETVRRIPVTRHLQTSDDPVLKSLGEEYGTISAIVPGVLAQTGIETAELLRGIAKTVSPDLLIAVDALAARSCTRLASTVQLSDTGLRPGSGIGNCRGAIDRVGIGVPVIAIGVPTVVSSATLVYDALSRAGIGDEEISPSLIEVLESGRNFFVSPKEIDSVTKRVAEVLSEAISEAFSVGEGDG